MHHACNSKLTHVVSRKSKLRAQAAPPPAVPLVHAQAQIKGVLVLDHLVKEESCTGIRDSDTTHAVMKGEKMTRANELLVKAIICRKLAATCFNG